jgi:tRNA (guanine37-N1)-methyltransferase
MLCSIMTLFPGAIRPYLEESILGNAQTRGKLEVELIDFRCFATDRHHSVDDRPFGGGPGMVLMPQPIFDAIENVESRRGPHHRVLLCPRGARFDQAKARELATKERLLLLCGRYEGIDERVRTLLSWDEISIGDYVLCGGELAALVVVEAVTRLLPGVLGCAESAHQDSFSNPDSDDLLDYPHYTRPREFRGLTVPDVLLSGDHQAVARWRRQRAEELTARRKHGAQPQVLPAPGPDQGNGQNRSQTDNPSPIE